MGTTSLRTLDTFARGLAEHGWKVRLCVPADAAAHLVVTCRSAGDVEYVVVPALHGVQVAARSAVSRNVYDARALGAGHAAEEVHELLRQDMAAARRSARARALVAA
ncbi:MAG: hypothetical protein M3P91_06265 [Actinomycetota bacterium]|nr:hypothetical protein [Actinomycetota bacterium]